MIITTNTRFKHVLTAIFSVLFLFLTISSKAEGEISKETTAEKFDAGKMIMEHISDAHEWHILGTGDNIVALPLPVILFTPKGLDVFMSSQFNHGKELVKTDKYTYRLEENNHIVALNDAGQPDEAVNEKIYDFSITKNVASLLFSVICITLIFISVANSYTRNPNKAPSGLQSFVEPLIVFIRDEVAKPSIGPKYEKFMPYLLTAFFFILFNNLLGLVPVLPGGANLTGNIAVTMVLALCTFAITTINGTGYYWKHIVAMPGVPKAVLIILTPIEILGVFLKPFVLMIRLFANMAAGHIIALSFFAMIFIFGEMSASAGLGVSVVSVAFTIFMGLLELLVAFLQAYVFVLLSAMYFGMALEEGHDH